MPITIRCLKPTVMNTKVGFVLSKVGETHDVSDQDYEVSQHWFDGQLRRGNIEIVEGDIEGSAPTEPSEPRCAFVYEKGANAGKQCKGVPVEGTAYCEKHQPAPAPAAGEGAGDQP
jgi:hypothetical protein